MRRIVAGALLSAFAAGHAGAQLPPPVPPAHPPAHCTAAEHGQLDFWLGEWDVYNTAIKDEMRGSSKVVKIHNGCAVQEDWHPFTMLTGGSLNAYDRRAAVWRQTWVDSMGERADLTGNLQGGKMVLTAAAGGPGAGRLSRLTLWPEGDTVRQLAESSTDGGATWQASFDFTYKRRKSR